MRYLPIHLDTKGRRIFVLGGGAAAEAKLRTLLKTDASILIIAANVSDEIQHWLQIYPDLKWHQENIEDNSWQRLIGPDVALIYAATENARLDSTIVAHARQIGLWVNAADQKPNCDFISPAIVDRAPVIVSIGTEGTSPGLARAIKAELENLLPSGVGRLAQTIKTLRQSVAKKLPSIADRQRFWSHIFGAGDLAAQLRRSPEALTSDVKEALSRLESDQTHNQTSMKGRVSLVGAGPGSADLLTLRARQVLHSADVIVYDRLVGRSVLDLARREAEYIYVGKKPGDGSVRQDTINAIIVQEALKGRHVVRLKGGDPLVFGRADEEIEALQQAGIPFDVTPGITAAAAAAASIGASLTARGQNKSVALLTGHDSRGFAEQDWQSLAAPGSRAAVYMGLGAARFIQGRLLLYGAEGSRPVTIVENASLEQEYIVSTTLENMVQDIEKYKINGPAILLLGYTPRQSNGDAVDSLFSKTPGEVSPKDNSKSVAL